MKRSYKRNVKRSREERKSCLEMKSNKSASCDRVNSVSREKRTRCQNLPRPLLPIPSLISNDGRLFPRSLKRKDTFVPFL
jgi:hypothetical protein